MGINIHFSSRDMQYINCFYLLFNSKEGYTITRPPLILSGYVPACFLNPPPPTHTPFKYGKIILKQIKFPKLY